VKSNFDFIAPAYDQLARLVFGKSIVESQLYFLNAIPEDASVLILGGGTGWLLEELITRKPNCSVCYIEASSKMLTLTNQRKFNEKMTFIHGTENDIPSRFKYDVVITNFYLDLFSEKKLDDVVKKITAHVSATGMWIATDFVDGKKWWHRLMLKVMYQFFCFTSGVEASTLPTWEKSMLQHLWIEQDHKLTYGTFIKSVILKRTPTI
jgi:ubiquinone/menaquinone biosynthesis C-methylase UbiE